MRQSVYRDFMDRLAGLVGISNPSELYARVDLKIDGEDCVLMPGGEHNDDAVAVFCTFGYIPEAQSERIEQELLEANLMLMHPDSMRFAINPESGEVMLAGLLPLEGHDPESLLTLLAGYASHARHWRQNYAFDSSAFHTSQEEFGNHTRMARSRRLS